MSAVELVALPLLTMRPATPVLSRIARPAPGCSRVPKFVNVALLPVMVTAFVLPLTISDPVSAIVPVCPEPDPRVCADVDEPVISKLPADALDSAKRPKATRIPVWIRTVFIENYPKRGDERLFFVQGREPRRSMMRAVYDG